MKENQEKLLSKWRDELAARSGALRNAADDLREDGEDDAAHAVDGAASDTEEASRLLGEALK